MKICVYAICKNEEKNIYGWFESMKEADKIFVLDTGSTDNSYELLKELGVTLKRKIINPWRFDKARNESLKMVDDDTDIFICTDFDERFEPGWRKQIEDNYQHGTTRIKYLYNWSFDENNNPKTTFYLDKIHTKNYKWKNPVHEILITNDEEKIQYIDNIILNHYQTYKETRKGYLDLLELSINEDPSNDRNMHYLGREYLYYKMYDKCIETLHNHLKMPSSNWKDERAASMRYIARSYLAKNMIEECILFYNLAIEEAPYLREAYVELAYLFYEMNNYSEAYNLFTKALNIKEKSLTYINEDFAWNKDLEKIYKECKIKINKNKD